MDKNLIVEARRTSIVEYLKYTGRVLVKEGMQFRVKKHSGLIVSENKWYSHSLSKGGNTLDFLIEIDHIEFKKALEILSMIENDTSENKFMIESKQLVLPKRNSDDKRVFAYLVKTRGLSLDVIRTLIKQGRIYEASVSHNCIFTGIDEDSKIRYAMQRSSLPSRTFKFESIGSDKRYSFSLTGTNDILCVFESPIDLLSYMTIYHTSSRVCSHMLSLGGTSDIALDSYIKRYPGISKIVFCLDNDTVGIQACRLLSDNYSNKGFKVYRNIPEYKDWNLQLLSLKG
jgi:Toprim-like/Protein of unknown function (DUF3991)